MTTTKHTRRYTAQSWAEVGYTWQIEAPETLSSMEVEKLQEALLYWSNEPDQKHLHDLLEDRYACEDYGLENLDQLRKVRFCVQCRHREFGASSFSKVVSDRDAAKESWNEIESAHSEVQRLLDEKDGGAS